MATSGSSNWTQTRDQIIQQIAEIVGLVSEGATASAKQITLISTKLNQHIKWLQVVHHIKLWKSNWTQKAFSAPSEVTGTDSEVYTCIKSHTSAADNKPITGDNWTTYWVKKGSTGGVWATSTSYTSTADFTDSADLIGVGQAFIRKNDNDTIVEVVSSRDFNKIPNKTDFGDPIVLWFDNKLSDTIYIHPAVEDYDDVVLHYEQILRIEDFDASGNTGDFPVHWIAPIVWNVSHDVALVYKLPIGELREIKRKADEYLSSILFSTQEYSEHMRIMPRMRR